MAAKQERRRKRPPKSANGKPPTLRAQNERLERELKKLREENRQLKKSLGVLMCKDDPVNMDLTPDDGRFEPPLSELIAALERTG
jgi:hypothetical protein